MELKEITTSEGHKVYLKQILTRKEVKQINLIAKSVIKVDYQTQKPKDVSLADLQKASRLVLDYLVVRIILPDGKDSKDLVDGIDNMSQDDEDALLVEADRITRDASIAKKNEITSLEK